MYRILLFMLSIIIPSFLGWWMFIPLALLFVFLAKTPYELLAAGIILDSFYYFGDSFWWKHALSIFSLALLVLAFALSRTIHWRKAI